MDGEMLEKTKARPGHIVRKAAGGFLAGPKGKHSALGEGVAA